MCDLVKYCLTWSFVNFRPSSSKFFKFCPTLSILVELCFVNFVNFCQIVSNFVKFGWTVSNLVLSDFVKYCQTLHFWTLSNFFTLCLVKLGQFISHFVFSNFSQIFQVLSLSQFLFNSRDSVGRVSLFLLSNKAYFFTGTEFTVSWDQNFLPSMSCLWRSCLFYETRIQNKSSISCRNAAQEKCLILSSLLAQQLPFVRWWRKKVDYLLEKSEKEFSTFLHLFFHFFFHFYFHSFSSWRMYFTIKRWK